MQLKILESYRLQHGKSKLISILLTQVIIANCSTEKPYIINCCTDNFSPEKKAEMGSPFQAATPYLYPHKTSEKRRFFKGYRNGMLA